MSYDLAIPKGATILVTGANGFIGSHIADQLLLAGYKVKGTVRSQEKGELIAEALKKRRGENCAFSSVVVPDMSTEGAFIEAMQDCSGVAHVASDLSFRDDPNLVITPVVAGVRNALKAAAAVPSVKRFVLTSSSLSLVLPMPNTKYQVDQNSWNEISTKEAWKAEGFDPATKPLHVYGASKVEGERAAWDFMKAENPGFVLNTVCPNFNVGEILDKRQPGSTASYIKAMWEGNPQIIQVLQGLPPQYEVDVKDSARLHVAGLMMDDVRGERLLAFTEPFNYSRWCESMRKIDPSKQFPPPPPNEPKDIGTIDVTRSVALLKRMGLNGFTPMDESVKQLIASTA